MGDFKMIFLQISTVKCRQNDTRGRVRCQEQYAKGMRTTPMKEILLGKVKGQHTVSRIESLWVRFLK